MLTNNGMTIITNHDMILTARSKIEVKLTKAGFELIPDRRDFIPPINEPTPQYFIQLQEYCFVIFTQEYKNKIPELHFRLKLGIWCFKQIFSYDILSYELFIDEIIKYFDCSLIKLLENLNEINTKFENETYGEVRIYKLIK